MHAWSCLKPSLSKTSRLRQHLARSLISSRCGTRRQIGMTEARLRKWLLSIAACLRSQNGSLADAVALWRANCEREFAGVEECLICYAVVAPSDGQLPRKACKTCSKRFHGACLYKWFKSSGKSACPHCQSPW